MGNPIYIYIYIYIYELVNSPHIYIFYNKFMRLLCVFQGFIQAILMSVIRHKNFNFTIESETQSSYVIHTTFVFLLLKDSFVRNKVYFT